MGPTFVSATGSRASLAQGRRMSPTWLSFSCLPQGSQGHSDLHPSQGKGCSRPGGAPAWGARRECRREEGTRAH